MKGQQVGPYLTTTDQALIKNSGTSRRVGCENETKAAREVR